VVLKHAEEVRANAFGVCFEEALASYLPNSREDLHSKVLTSDGSDNVNRILLLLDKIGPDAKDVATSVHIDIVMYSGNVRLKRFGVVDL
jgi:hypothetical protein